MNAVQNSPMVFLDTQSFVPERDVSDCYTCLGIKRDASILDVKNAFRRLALSLHPERKSGNSSAVVAFTQICEAYEILKDPITKGIYDLFGKEGLENGLPADEGKEPFLGFKYHGDIKKTFNDFFGSENVFQELFRERLYDKALGIQKVGYQSLKPAPVCKPPIVTALQFSLEELYSGTVRRVSYKRKACYALSDKDRIVEENFTIAVPPGTRDGTRFVFKNMGDEAPNTIAADVEFVVKQIPHARFTTLNDHDLFFRKSVSLEEALTGTLFLVDALDGRSISVAVPEIIHPHFRKVVEKEGMPKCTPATSSFLEKGNLIIEFDIRFPRYLNPKQKENIKKTLAEQQNPSE